MKGNPTPLLREEIDDCIGKALRIGRACARHLPHRDYEDVLSDSLYGLALALNAYHAERGPFEPFMKCCVRNEIRSGHRRRGRIRPLSLVDIGRHQENPALARPHYGFKRVDEHDYVQERLFNELCNALEGIRS